MQVASLGGARYYVVYTVRLSLRFSVCVSALHRRLRALSLFQGKAVHAVRRQLSTAVVTTLRTNRGGDFKSHDFC